METALELLLDFARRTGLPAGGAQSGGHAPPDRYLWTDAFAVCTFVGLGRLNLARDLVEQVHATLGSFSPGDARKGRLSGLTGNAALAQPTMAGLRIGKPRLERRPDEPFDERLEWDRDGQYFHYLAKWMQALDTLARATRDSTYNVWARELARTAHRAFTRTAADGARRMAWKMSVDLSRALVPSMGQHDPLDGYLTCLQLDATAALLRASDRGPALAAEAADFVAMIPDDLATSDPLGLGGLLADAWRAQQLWEQSALTDPGLRDRLLEAIRSGVRGYADSSDRRLPIEYRLAFRELGLAIGLAAMPHLPAGRDLVDVRALRDAITTFWLRDEHRAAPTYLEHRNINDVMLATSLAPEGYLSFSA